MSLNIKNPRTHQLVRELATALQVSQTDAVTLAVEEALHRDQNTYASRLKNIRKTATQIRAHVKNTSESDREIYDRDGLFT